MCPGTIHTYHSDPLTLPPLPAHIILPLLFYFLMCHLLFVLSQSLLPILRVPLLLPLLSPPPSTYVSCSLHHLAVSLPPPSNLVIFPLIILVRCPLRFILSQALLLILTFAVLFKFRGRALLALWDVSLVEELTEINGSPR